MRLPMRLFAAIVASVTVGGLATASQGNIHEDRWMKAIGDLHSPDLEVSQKAAESIAKLAVEGPSDRKQAPEQIQARDKRLKALKRLIRDKNEDPRVRGRLVHALAVLGELGKKDAQVLTPTLLDALRDEADDEDVRAEVVGGLPYIGPPDQVEPAVLATTEDKNPDVRVCALQALSHFDIDANTLMKIIGSAIDSTDPSTRVAAVNLASGLMSEHGDKRALQVLLRALHDRDRMVRFQAVLLVQFSGREVKDAAKAELGKLVEGPDPVARVSAAAALLDLTGDIKRYGGILMEALRSKKPPMWIAAGDALATLNPKKARPMVPELKDNLHDPDVVVRVYSASALMHITGDVKEYLPFLIEGLASKEEALQWWSAGMLDRSALRDAKALKSEMLKAAKHKEPVVRASAVMSLGNLSLDCAVATEIFTGALRDEDPRVRTAALEALGNMEPSARHALPEIR